MKVAAFVCCLALLCGTAVSAQKRAPPKPVPPKPVYGGTLVIAQAVEPPGLDPTTATSTAIPRVVYGNVLEGLVRIDRDGKIVPCLATEVKTSKDGKEYTFLLKKGVTFHDGKPFAAEDVKFTFDRLMDPKTIASHPEYYRGIESIRVVNSSTVTFRLKNVNAMFLFNLARGDSVIVNKLAADRLKSEPVGTGPIKFVEWVRGDLVDDEEPLPAILEGELTESGEFVVDTAADGGEAINRIQAKVYDVILLDLRMPRVSGMTEAPAATQNGSDLVGK